MKNVSRFLGTAVKQENEPKNKGNQMRRFLLINPPETEQLGFTNPPLGLLYLAGTLITHGFDVRLVDGCLDGKGAIEKALEEFKPEMVGIPCLTPGRMKSIEMARLAKSMIPECKVILGGAHATIMFRQLLENFPEIDLIVIGEGEESCLEIAQERPLDQIKGIAYRDLEGNVVQNPLRPLIRDLDTIPFPAWHIIDLSRYPGRGNQFFRGIDLGREPRISVVFSRGCKGHCDFCSTWWIWRGWRHRSATNMADELEILYHRHGIRHFCFADDAMTVDRLATIDLCNEILRRNLHIAFHVTTRTDCVDEELLRKLHAAGCYKVAFGIETGSPELLKSMNKENDLATSEQAIRLCRKIGLPTTALMIIGNIGETAETVAQTRRFLKRTNPDEIGTAGGLWVLPGTKVYRECKKRNIIDDSFWLGRDPYLVYTQEHSIEQLSAFAEEIANFRSPILRVIGKIQAVFSKIAYHSRHVYQTSKMYLQAHREDTKSRFGICKKNISHSGFAGKTSNASKETRISAVLIARNEERNLEACLSTLTWCDEIIVVDMESEDRTGEIARKFTDAVFSHPHVIEFDIAKKFAVEHASGEMILLIDADEMVSWPLAQTLKRIAQNDEADIVFIPFNHYIMGDLVDHSGWGGTCLPRFFKRGTIRFRETIHDFIELDPGARTYRLPPVPANMMEHFCYRDAEHFLQKLNHYTTAEAIGRFKAGHEFRLIETIMSPLREFQGRYLRGGGWRGGFRGFALCIFMAFYRFVSLVKLWEINHIKDSSVTAHYEKLRSRILAGHPLPKKG